MEESSVLNIGSSSGWGEVWLLEYFGSVQNFNRTSPWLFLVFVYIVNLASLWIITKRFFFFLQKWDYVHPSTGTLWMHSRGSCPYWNSPNEMCCDYRLTTVDSGWDHFFFCNCSKRGLLATNTQAGQMMKKEINKHLYTGNSICKLFSKNYQRFDEKQNLWGLRIEGAWKWSELEEKKERKYVQLLLLHNTMYLRK